ncbi:MAG: hypothetical protein VYB08_03565 [Candidatus Latescibacterota bacterium]|nr:hypothetical protein [Candidatus Latescibacterota bacterium]
MTDAPAVVDCAHGGTLCAALVTQLIHRESPMVRALLAVIAGIAVSRLSIDLLESIGHSMYPRPEGLDPYGDPEGFAVAVKQMPTGALAVVLLAWAMATFIGAWLAARIVGRPFYGLLVGGVMMLGGVSKIVAVPHPWWFTVIGILLFLPSAYAGARLATPGS